MYLSRGYYNRSRKNFGSIIKKYFKLIRFINISQIIGHRFLAELEEKGKDITILTQNIDGLHQLGGSKHVIDLHGTLQTAHCPKCKTGYDLQYMIDHEVPRCQKCNFILNQTLFYTEIHCRNIKMRSNVYMKQICAYRYGNITKSTACRFIPTNCKEEVGATTVLVNEELTGQEYNFDFVFQNKIGEFVDGLSSRK